MASEDIESIINTAWDGRKAIDTETGGEVREAVEAVLNRLDSGAARIAEKIGSDWIVHQWLKKAVLLSFKLNETRAMGGGPDG